MAEDVKSPRRYHSPRRAEQAAVTRRAVLAAAREVFVERGYGSATVAEIATRAGVALDTVYASVGRKPALLRELVETALSGGDVAVPAHQRDYVAHVRAAAGAAEKLAIYARAVAAINQRLAAVFLVLRDAAVTDRDCAALWAEISGRRARNMRDLAADLRGTGQLRADLDDGQVADVVWSMNSAEYWDLLVGQRGWSSALVADWLADAWTRLLLAPGSPPSGATAPDRRRVEDRPAFSRRRPPATSGRCRGRPARRCRRRRPAGSGPGGWRSPGPTTARPPPTGRSRRPRPRERAR